MTHIAEVTPLEEFLVAVFQAADIGSHHSELHYVRNWHLFTFIQS